MQKQSLCTGWRLLREGTAAAGQWAWACSIIHPFIQDTPPALWSCTHRGVQKWLHSLEGLPGKINPGEGELLEPLEGSLPKPGISGRPQGDTCKVEMVQSLLEDLICMRTLMWASS